MADNGFSYEDAVGAPPPAAQGFSYEDAVGTPPLAPTNRVAPSFTSDISRDVVKNLQDPNGGAFGQAMGIVGDVGGEAIKRVPGVVPAAQAVSGAMHSGAQSVANAIDNPTTEEIANSAGNAVNAAGDYIDQSPNLKSFLGGAKRIASGMGTLTGVGDAAASIPSIAEGAGPFLKNTASGGADVLPTPSAPPKIRNYDQIKAANGRLSDTTSAHYQKAEELGASLTPEATQSAAEQAQSHIDDNLEPDIHGKTIGALKLFIKKANAAVDEGNGLNWQSIDATRKNLNNIAYDSSAGTNDVGAAKQAIKSMDGIFDSMQQNPDALSSGAPAAIDALKDARQASALEQRHSDVAAILRKANNNPNAIQSGMKALYDDEDAFGRFAPEDQALIKDIAHPGKLVSNLQTVGKMGPGGNGTINVAEAAAMLSMNPVAQGLAATAGVTGAGANIIRSKLVRGSAEQLLKNIEARSVAPTAIDYGDEADSALERASQPPPPKPLGLPAPQTTNYVNSAGQNVPLTPAAKDSIGSSPSTASERTPADNLRAQEAAKQAQSEILRDYGTKRIKDYEGFKRGGAVNKQPTEAQKLENGKRYLVKIPHIGIKHATLHGFTSQKSQRAILTLDDKKRLTPPANKLKFYEIAS